MASDATRSTRTLCRLLSLTCLLALAACATGPHSPHVTRTQLPAPATPSPKTTSQPPSIYERGEASYYAAKFDGRATTSGEAYDPDALTAAHRKLPLGTQVRVVNLDNDKHVTVRINDRGPFVGGRVIDLSKAAAKKLKMRHAGVAPVSLQIVSTSS